MILNYNENMKTTKRLLRDITKPNVWFVERVESAMKKLSTSAIPAWISKTHSITTDPLKAKQFETREDAQYYITYNKLAPDWIATEHEFIDQPKPVMK